MSRYLLLQIRDTDDPMRLQEIACFARALGCEVHEIAAHNLLSGSPGNSTLFQSDIILIGGSKYSVTEQHSWLNAAFRTLEQIVSSSIPTFASCWGCQAFAQAMGGQVRTDVSRAELGMHEVFLTDEAMLDPLFGGLSTSFLAPMGHQDHVALLPRDSLRLAYSGLVENQAFRFIGKPIYCTQFHPELNRVSILERVSAYPHYLDAITGQTAEEFVTTCPESEESNKILGRFISLLENDQL